MNHLQRDTQHLSLGAFLTYQQDSAVSSAASPPVPTPVGSPTAPSPGQAVQHPLTVLLSGLSGTLQPGWMSFSKLLTQLYLVIISEKSPQTE